MKAEKTKGNLLRFLIYFFLSFILLVFLSLFSRPGGGDFATKLPNGYRLIRCNSSEIVIVRSAGEGVLEPPLSVDAYTVVGKIITGHVSMAAQYPDDPTGYFIIDTDPKNMNTLDEQIELSIKYEAEQEKKGLSPVLNGHAFILKKFPHNLNKDMWLKSLKEYGINYEPVLHSPTQFDRNFF